MLPMAFHDSIAAGGVGELACCDIPGVVIRSILSVPSIEWPFARYAFDVLSSTKRTRVCGTCLETAI